MARLVSLKLAIDPASLDAMRASLAALGGVLDGLPGEVGHSFMLPDDLGNLVRVEAPSVTAAGATVLHGLQILPGDGYLELVSAVADHAHAHVVRIIHGWPLLSSASPPPMVADGDGPTSPSPDGEVVA